MINIIKEKMYVLFFTQRHKEKEEAKALSLPDVLRKNIFN
jgi:hypothetical protein